MRAVAVGVHGKTPVRAPRAKGLIERLPRSNAYRITDDGLRFAVFYTKSTTDY